jgi:hypothetical protein
MFIYKRSIEEGHREKADSENNIMRAPLPINVGPGLCLNHEEKPLDMIVDPEGSLHSVPGFDLPEYIVKMSSNGVAADIEPRGDVFVVEAPRHHEQDVKLSRAQRVSV